MSTHSPRHAINYSMPASPTAAGDDDDGNSLVRFNLLTRGAPVYVPITVNSVDDISFCVFLWNHDVCYK